MGACFTLKRLLPLLLLLFLAVDAFSQAEVINAAGTYWRLRGNSSTDTSTHFMGTLDAAYMTIRTNNVRRMTFDISGRVGIGTTTPQGTLETVGKADGNLVMAITNYGNPTELWFKRAQGNIGAPTIIGSSGSIGRIDARGYDGSAFQNAARIEFVVDSNSGSGNMPGRIVFSTNPPFVTGTPTERMRINRNGLVGVNTTAPATRLDINGDLALRQTTLTLVNGSNDNVNISPFPAGNSYYRITGPTAAFSLTGLTAGADGRIVILQNATTQTLTVKDQTTSSVSNRIMTGGGDLVVGDSGTVTLIYSTTDNRWQVQAFTNAALTNTTVSNSWLINGNSGTTAGTNFVGTTDAQDLVLKRFNVEGIRLTTGGALWATGNTGTGVTPTAGAGTRMMWIPAKGAFRAGDVTGTQWDDANIGSYSAVFGRNNQATGTHTLVSGNGNNAAGNFSVVFNNTASSTAAATTSIAGGFQSQTQANLSVAIGWADTAKGVASVALGGFSNEAQADNSFSTGNNNLSSGTQAATFGSGNTASGSNSFATGNNNNVSGQNSFVTGNGNTVTATHALVSGNGNNAAGNFSVVLNNTASTTAVATTSIAGGFQSQVQSNLGLAIGWGDTTSGVTAEAFGRGNYARSFAEFSVGIFGTDYVAANASGHNTADRAFNVGIGTAANARADAFTVLKGGNVRVSGIATGGTFITTPSAVTDKIMFADALGDLRAMTAGTTGQVLTYTASGPAWAAASTGNDWALLGNSGTTAGTNFVGTTDAQDLVFKRSSVEGIRLTTGGALWGSGNTGTGVTPTSGAGTRMMWIPAKAAFRAGIVSGTQWDDANVGVNSAVFGQNNTASGTNTFVAGNGNTAAGNYSTVLNQFNRTTSAGSYAIAGGYESSVEAMLAYAIGWADTAKGVSAVAIGGWNNSADAENSFATGYSNTATGNQSAIFGDNGRVSGGSALVTGSANNVSANYSIAGGSGNIVSGSRTLTMGENNTVSSTRSMVSGINNNIAGENNIVSGVQNYIAPGYGHAIVVGYQDSLSGSASAVFGFLNKTTAFTNFAAGDRNLVTGQTASAFGYQNVASGTNSFVTGQQDTTAGDLSSVFGTGNRASSFNEMVVGMYATRYTAASTSAHNTTDRVFNVGIGTAANARADAFTIIKGGNVRVAGLATGGAFITIPSAVTDKIMFADALGDLRAMTGGSTGNVLTYTASGPAWNTLTDNTDWNLTGNSGTVDGTNFIGTTDNVPFTIRTNNQQSGRVDPLLSNTFLGYWAGRDFSTGTQNVAVGTNALLKNITGRNNTALGNSALENNMGGLENTAVGSNAMQNNESSKNVAVGVSALAGNNTGDENVAVGHSALFTNTTGYTNVAIGSRALYNNTTGLANLAAGHFSLSANTTGAFNVALGLASMLKNTTGGVNVAIGEQSLFENTIGNQNVAVGDQALQNNVAGSGSVAIGYFAMKNTNNTTSAFITNNVAVGANALCGNLPPATNTGVKNVAIGSSVLRNNSSGNDNTALGNESLFSNSTGNANTAIGSSALYSNVSGSDLVAIGDSALVSQNGGAGRNTAVGSSSLWQNTTGQQNTAVGRAAIAGNTTGWNNAAVGYLSLHRYVGDNNAAFGSQSLRENLSGNFNTAVGTFGLVNTTGGSNTAVGYTAGSTNVTGTKNSFFGESANPTTNALTNATAIGANALVGQSNTVVLGSINGINSATSSVRVGIGTTTPATKLTIYDPDNVNVTLRIASVSTAYEPAVELMRTGAGGEWKIRTNTTGQLAFSRSPDDFATNVDYYEMTAASYRPVIDGNNSLGEAGARWSTVYATVGAINTSDIRDKENIAPLNYGVNEIMKLNPVTFSWKDNPQWGRKIGFIAQEVQPVLREVVQVGNLKTKAATTSNMEDVEQKETNKLGIYYSDIIPVTVKAIQEQQQMLDAVKKENADLKIQLQLLKEQFDAFQKK